MIQLIALVLTLDGGTSIGGLPYENPDAGVYQVLKADLGNGVTLGRGWWLSDERMSKVGSTLVEKENQLTACRHENKILGDTPCGPSLGFWAGVTIGGVVGVLVIGFIGYKLIELSKPK